MANETMVTVLGNLTADPELRFTPGGHAVCNFTVANTARRFNSATNEWEDGEPMFLRCNAWRQLAENITESLEKGARVVVHGILMQKSFETREGERRTVFEIDVRDVGASLLFSTAKLRRATRGSEPVEEDEPAALSKAREARQSGRTRTATRSRRG